MVTTEEMKYLKICDSYLGNVEYGLTFKSAISLYFISQMNKQVKMSVLYLRLTTGFWHFNIISASLL